MHLVKLRFGQRTKLTELDEVNPFASLLTQVATLFDAHYPQVSLSWGKD